MHGRLILLALLALLPACGDPAPPEVAASNETAFDPAQTGTLTGSVRWRGEIPNVPALRSVAEPLVLPEPGVTVLDWPNPNAPRIDPATHALSSAVVFLRGVDALRARPWHHPPAVVELREQQFSLNTPFVRAGHTVSFVSRDARLHAVQARGEAFFALTLPHADQPRSRQLTTPGVVELLSGTGYHWMRAYLHVAEHPYCAQVDAKGEFRLEQVPAGEYDLVAWHPSWHIRASERNPDLGRVQQVRFGSPHEVVTRVRVGVGKESRVEVVFSR